MCGRFIVSYTYDELLGFLSSSYEINGFDLDYTENYNVTPGQPVLSVIKTKKDYKVGYIDWGFIPSFATDIKSSFKMSNARSETVKEKSSFKNSFKNKRCLIIVNGYYEWERKAVKQPYVIKREDNKIFAFAGLWEVNRKIGNNPIYSTTILTKESDEFLNDIHHRMPVILSYEDSLVWLDEESSIDDLDRVIGNSSHEGFHKYKVSNYVNKSSNNGPECIEPL